MTIRNVKQDLADLSDQTVNDIRMSRLMKFSRAADNHRKLEATYGDELNLNVPNMERVRNLVAQVLEEEADEVNGELPVISVFDAHQQVKGDKAIKSDMGLRSLCGHLQRMWDKSLDGNGPSDLTADAFMQMKAHYARNYPKSKVSKVIENFGKKGYATLNRNDLIKIASEIETQGDFERVIIESGLQGRAPNQVKARKFILACVNGQERQDHRPSERGGRRKKAQSIEQGEYLTFELQGDNLLITPTPEGIERAQESEGVDWPMDDMLEDILVNSDWELVQPEDIGALTESVILSNEVYWDEDGEITSVGTVYWHPNYMVEDEMSVWAKGEPVLFQGVKDEEDRETKDSQIKESKSNRRPFDRRGQVDEKYKAITEMRNALNDVGLYYVESAANFNLRYMLDESDDPEDWVMIQGYKDMMTHMDESNMEAVLSALNEDIINVKKVEGGEYAVRALDENGEFTRSGEILNEIIGELSDYPVLSDEDMSKREFDETVENIRSEGWGSVNDDVAPADWAEQVFDWLWTNNQEALESRTDKGGSFVDGDDIQAALMALGWLYEDEDEE